MELKQVANYLSGRYMIIDRKKDKDTLLHSQLLASCSVDSLGSTKEVVTYYDTPDFFFSDKGINLYTVISKNYKDLIIKYDSEQVRRIEFLKNTPNFFKVSLNNKHDNIAKYNKEITDAVYQVFPEGIQVNVDDLLRQSRPQIIINKKCDNYRVVNNNGLKTSISFVNAIYINQKTRQKFAQDSLEVVGEANISKERFDNFIKLIVLDCPNLIKTSSNELTIARNNFKD